MQFSNNISIKEAARRAGVPFWKVKKLAIELIIFGAETSKGYMLSKAVVETLPELCRQHFSDRGEFLHNTPIATSYRSRTVEGITTAHYRGTTV